MTPLLHRHPRAPRIPERWRGTAEILTVLGEALTVLAVLVLAAYWLYVHGRDPITVALALALLLPLYGAVCWLLVRDRITREKADRAEENSDRALTGVADLRGHLEQADTPTAGRHAARKVAR